MTKNIIKKSRVTGIPRSEEVKEKIRLKLKGIPKSEETKKRMSEAKQNLSEEHKLALQNRCKQLGHSNKGKVPWNLGKSYKLHKKLNKIENTDAAAQACADKI